MKNIVYFLEAGLKDLSMLIQKNQFNRISIDIFFNTE